MASSRLHSFSLSLYKLSLLSDVRKNRYNYAVRRISLSLVAAAEIFMR